MGTHPIFESDFDCLTDMSAFIAESTWVNRAHYEGAWDAYQVFKATGTTVQAQKEANLDMDRIAKLETENAGLKKKTVMSIFSVPMTRRKMPKPSVSRPSVSPPTTRASLPRRRRRARLWPSPVS